MAFSSNSHATPPAALQPRKRGPGRRYVPRPVSLSVFSSADSLTKQGSRRKIQVKKWVPNSGPDNQPRKTEPQSYHPS